MGHELALLDHVDTDANESGGAQQIRDEAGQLDVRFFQQRFQSIVQLHAVARDLVLAAHHRPPESLLVADDAGGKVWRVSVKGR